MWDKATLAVKKMRSFNSLLDQFGGEEGIRTLDPNLGRLWRLSRNADLKNDDRSKN